MAEGKKTGFFTSPHLVSVNERIRINNQQISDERFLEIFKEVENGRADGGKGLGHPSYFEFLFGMGMLIFTREVGLHYSRDRSWGTFGCYQYGGTSSRRVSLPRSVWMTGYFRRYD